MSKRRDFTKDEISRLVSRLRKCILSCIELPEKERVAAYNAATSALREMVSDLCDDPVLGVQLIPVDRVVANDYNPNNVASPEMDLLEDSIRADGVTMPVVVIREDEIHVTVDGFHRQIVIRDRLKRKYAPCSVIDADDSNRIASTIRHNRARGKHQVDLMAEIVRSLIEKGWNDAGICQHIGMSDEELLRLKQSAGVAKLLAGSEYSKSWGPINEGKNNSGKED